MNHRRSLRNLFKVEGVLYTPETETEMDTGTVDRAKMSKGKKKCVYKHVPSSEKPQHVVEKRNARYEYV